MAHAKAPSAASQIDVIIGPTASGKTAHAITHAHDHDGVIINADSMQIYDALPILTAQPDLDEQAQAPHNLYAHLAANETCGAGRWRDMVIPVIDEALAQGKRPILVGGSGFYINALMNGFSPIPDIPASIRTRLETLPLEERYATLQKDDPTIAERLHPNDSQRITRALEVYAHTGKPLSAWQAVPLIHPPSHYTFHIISLLPPREDVYEKINKRVHKMIALNVMDEVRALSEAIDSGDVAMHMPIIKAHGFRALRAVLNDTMSLDDAIAQTQQETRNYAKRQYTWARHQIQADRVIT